MAGTIYEFGPYRLELATRRLLRDGEPLPLTPKAFDVLVALIERRDRVVDKSELMKLVWADSFVEEANLSQTIFVLRKTLGEQASGEQYIDTIPRRGYRFTADVRTTTPAPARAGAVMWGGAAVAAVLIVGLAVTTWTVIRTRRTNADPLAGKMRLVVLPFENLSRDQKDDWLAGAFSDSLTIGLQDIDDVICVDRDRVVELYRQRSLREGAALDARSLRDLSSLLTVRYYVHGTFQRFGDRVRVNARLVEADTGDVLAQESVTDYFANLLSLEDDLGRRFSEKLQGAPRATAAHAGAASLEAYQAVIEARSAYALGRFNDATRALQRATALDPRYAHAWALLSKTSSRLAAESTFEAGSLAELHQTALTSAQRAIAIDPSLNEAHVALALAYRDTGEVDKWRAETGRAIALNPRVAEAYELMADSYSAMPAYGCRRDRNATLADQYFQTALKIDQRFAAAWANFAYHLYWSARAEEAVRTADEGLKVLPENVGIMRARAAALMRMGRADAADAQIQEIALRGNPLSAQDHYVRGAVALIRGNAAAAKEQFDVTTMLLPTVTFPLSIGRVYFDNGRLDQGLPYIDKAVQLEVACAQFIAMSPAFAAYRDTPQFRARLAAWKSAP